MLNQIPGWVIQIILFVVLIVGLAWLAGQLGLHF